MIFTIIIPTTEETSEIDATISSLVNNLRSMNNKSKIVILNYGEHQLKYKDKPNIEYLHAKIDKYEAINNCIDTYKCNNIVLISNNIKTPGDFVSRLNRGYNKNVIGNCRVCTVKNTATEIDKRIGSNITPSMFKDDVVIFDSSLNPPYSATFADDIDRQIALYRNIRVWKVIKNKTATKQPKPSTPVVWEKFENQNTKYSIIIPFMFNGDRYPLFEKSLDQLYAITKDNKNIEIVVHETSPSRFISDKMIRKYKLKYTYTEHIGVFDIAFNYNKICKSLIKTDVFVFFDADLIVDRIWLDRLLTSDPEKCYIGWTMIKYISERGTFNYIKGIKGINDVKILRTMNYIKGETTGGINIIPKKMLFDVKGWPEDFKGLGYGCIDHSMAWKIMKIYDIDVFPCTIRHLYHKHKTEGSDKRFPIKNKHRKLDKKGWTDHIKRINVWGGKGVEINVIVIGSDRVFMEPVSSLINSLHELGYNTKINWFDKGNVPIRDVNLYIGDFRGRDVKIDDSKYNIYWCSEQYLSCCRPKVAKYYQKCIDKFDVVVDMFKHNILKPNKKVIHRYCPVGWSSVYEKNYNPTIKTKNIDMLHLGTLQITNSTIPNISKLVTVKHAFGKKRDDFIQKSKINLSLQTFHEIGYEWTPYRMMFVIGLRGFLMAEKHIDYGPYTPGKHFIVFDDINKCYNEWIYKDKERKEFGIEAYNDIKKNHQYTMYIEEALKGLL